MLTFADGNLEGKGFWTKCSLLITTISTKSLQISPRLWNVYWRMTSWCSVQQAASCTSCQLQACTHFYQSTWSRSSGLQPTQQTWYQVMCVSPVFSRTSCNTCNCTRFWYSAITFQKQRNLYKMLENIEIFNWFKLSHHHHHHHHHISVMEFGHLLTRSGLTCPEVSSKVCHDSFCQLGNSVSLP